MRFPVNRGTKYHLGPWNHLHKGIHTTIESNVSNLAKLKAWRNFRIGMEEREDDGTIGTWSFEKYTWTVGLDSGIEMHIPDIFLALSNFNG